MASNRTKTTEISSEQSRSRKKVHAQSTPPSRQPQRSLQDTMGNKAVNRLIQCALPVSQPGDPLEREADRTAETVMRMHEPVVSQPRYEVNAYTRNAGGSVKSPQVRAVNQGSLYRGELLTANDRAFFEPRFGCDFSSIRVHTDYSAIQLATAIDAKAFTHGSDIYLRSGRYPLASTEDRALLAHELTHTIQQGQASSLGHRGFPNGGVHVLSKPEVNITPVSRPIIQRFGPILGRLIFGRIFGTNTPPSEPEPRTESPPSRQVVHAQPEAMPEYLEEVSEELPAVEQQLSRAEPSEDRSRDLSQIRHLIRLKALNIMRLHRTTIVGTRDRDIHSTRGSRRTWIGTQAETFFVLRRVADEIFRLTELRARLERSERNLRRHEIDSRYRRRFTFEWLFGLSGSGVHDIAQLVARRAMDPSGGQTIENLLRNMQGGLSALSNEPSRYALVSRIASRIAERKRQQIQGVNQALTIYYQHFPAFSEISAEEVSTSRRYIRDTDLGIALTHAYVNILNAVDHGIQQIATGDIHPYDMPEAVRVARETLSPRMRVLLDEDKRDRQTRRFWEEMGYGAMQIALVFIPVVGPSLAAALGVAVLGLQLEELVDRAIMQQASGHPERGMLGVRGPNALDYAMIAAQAVLSAVELGAAVRAFGRGGRTALTSASTEARIGEETVEPIMPFRRRAQPGSGPPSETRHSYRVEGTVEAPQGVQPTSPYVTEAGWEVNLTNQEIADAIIERTPGMGPEGITPSEGVRIGPRVNEVDLSDIGHLAHAREREYGLYIDNEGNWTLLSGGERSVPSLNRPNDLIEIHVHPGTRPGYTGPFTASGSDVNIWIDWLQQHPEGRVGILGATNPSGTRFGLALVDLETLVQQRLFQPDWIEHGLDLSMFARDLRRP